MKTKVSNVRRSGGSMQRMVRRHLSFNVNDVILEHENGVCLLAARKGTTAEKTLLDALNIRCPLPDREEALALRQHFESRTGR